MGVTTMDNQYAYIRAGAVAHVAPVGTEPMADLETVVEVEAGTVAIADLYDCATGKFSKPETFSPAPPTVGAIAFQRLFTRAERVKACELRAIDPELDDIWRQIEDPRTDVVVLALPSVQDDIEYTLNAIKASGVEIDVAARKAKILTGQIQ